MSRIRQPELSLSLRLALIRATGPPQTQVGFLHREAWFTAWALFGAGSGLEEAEIERERAKDEIAIPFHDVGLYIHSVVIYAVKAG